MLKFTTIHDGYYDSASHGFDGNNSYVGFM